MHAPHSDACESSFAIARVISLWSLHEDYGCYWRQQSLHLFDLYLAACIKASNTGL